MKRILIFLFLIFSNFVGLSFAFEEEVVADTSNIFYRLYGQWQEKDWQKWVREEVYLLITEEQKEQLFKTPLQHRWLRAQELWWFWGQASGLGEEKFFYIFQERLKLAREAFGNTVDDRARIFLLFGPAERIIAVNSSSSRQTPSLEGVENLTCKYLGNLEIWIWGAVPRLSLTASMNYPVVVIFHKVSMTTFRLWDPQISSFSVLQQKGDYYSAEYESPGIIGSVLDIVRECIGGQDILKLINLAQLWLEKSEARPFFFHFFPKGVRGSSAEEYLNFSRFSPLPHLGDKEVLKVKNITFVQGKRPSITTRAREVLAEIIVLNENLVPYSFRDGKEVIQLKVNWVIFKKDEWVPWLFLETTHTYVHPEAELIINASFNLTPGEYIVRAKIGDSNSKAVGTFVYDIIVEPTLDVSEKQIQPQLQTLEAFEAKDTFPQIIGDIDGPYSIGLKKFIVLTGNLPAAKVAFFLDDELLLIVNRAPFEAEIDLGGVPRQRVVKAVIYDDRGGVIGEVTRLVNVGENRFVLRLEDSREENGKIIVSGQIYVPKEKNLEKIEVYLGEKLTAILPPSSVQKNRFLVAIPKGQEMFVRALAILDDGSREEALLLLHEGVGSMVEVIAVELPVAALKRGRPVKGLRADDFIVYESIGDKKERQTISAVQSGQDVPLNIGILFDVSSSMTELIRRNQKFVIEFLERVMKKEDRAFIMAFTEVPQLAVGLTSNIQKLEEAIIPLSSTGWTALYDAIATSIVQFSGLRGRKVLLVFTDGHDTASHIKFEELIRALRHSPVSIYFLIPPTAASSDKKILEKIADLTGGGIFSVKDIAEELERIEEELRSGYILAYTSTLSGFPARKFRKVEVQVIKEKIEIKTIDGYYPE